MEEKLDKDFFPIWLCKVAGMLFPCLYLLGLMIGMTVHRAKYGFVGWAMVAWLVLLLAVFWHRYRSDEVASLWWEFQFGCYLSFGPIVWAFPAPKPDRDWWGMIGFFGLMFVLTAIQYVRYFYLPPDRKKTHSRAQANW